MDNKNYNEEKRRYIRLKSVFPVEFLVLPLKEKGSVASYWRQGYTSNVSAGGICLETTDIDKKTLDAILQRSLFEIRFRLHLTRPMIPAKAEVAWIQKQEESGRLRFHIGLKFLEIEPRHLRRMLFQARWHQFSLKIVFSLAVLFLMGFFLSVFHNHQLRYENQKLISQMVDLGQKVTQDHQALEKINEEKMIVKEKIEQSPFDGRVDLSMLEKQYEGLLSQEKQIADRMNLFNRQKEGLQAKVLTKMYQWLKNHQSLSTGLIQSFEGDVNIVKDWAFTYDQALGVIVFLLFNDRKAASDILNFYQRILSSDFKGFSNGYYYDSGKVAEFTIHCGPNIWLGLAILQYIHQTRDLSYLPLAEKIADWIISLQEEDPQGGLKGGPGILWFATEHNLDAYAFFSMLEIATKQKKYTIAKEKIFSWLKRYAMVPHPQDYLAPPLNRGRGDSFIATDTFAWSLAAIGPGKLEETGMDPEQIMEFAREHCGVKVSFKRPSGILVEAEGFDFSKYSNIARGGIISPEWTSQMIVSYQMLGKYLEKRNAIKSGYYKQLANKYLDELSKLIIASPSPKGQGEGCLPYATMENADTGHGWLTPNGASTCSIAGTAYMIMAIKEFNPLMFPEKGTQ